MDNQKEQEQKKALFNFGKNAGKKTLKTANNTRKYIVKKISQKIGLGIALTSILMFFVTGILIITIFSFVSQSSDNETDTGFNLSAEVKGLTPIIQIYAQKHNIAQYIPLIQAIMQVESGGKGTDPMQASECPFNDRYPRVPDSIKEVSYSIDVGCEYLAYCINEAGATGIKDIPKIQLVAQGYNYGNGYISWALNNYGGYSKENALEFSLIKQEELGWSGYGDPEYVSKVFKYLPKNNTGVPHQDIVNIALGEVGNNYSKYGLSSDWCGAFISWCARQSNIPETEIKTYYSVWQGIQWFDSQGRFKESAYRGGSYTPNVGDIIFINWNGLLGYYDGNHTGLVTKVENGKVYTVEGNTNGYGDVFWKNSVVSEQSYSLNSKFITGYGIYN